MNFHMFGMKFQIVSFVDLINRHSFDKLINFNNNDEISGLEKQYMSTKKGLQLKKRKPICSKEKTYVI